jgi:hypothetical protein
VSLASSTLQYVIPTFTVTISSTNDVFLAGIMGALAPQDDVRKQMVDFGRKQVQA